MTHKQGHAQFRLHELGWHTFQQLCLTITREVLGQTVVGFLNTHDGGRDGAFQGEWSARPNEIFTGHFVIQCKHTSQVGHNLQPSDLGDELKKARRLVEAGRCDVYVLMTNAGVSGKTEQTLHSLFRECGVTHFLCFEASWISGQIATHKILRMSIPRLYGLGDLSQILDERAYSQATCLLASLQEDLARVVLTSSYTAAADALREYGFVLLLGEPASGKTTIAAMLSMAAIDQWNCSVMKLDEPSQVVEHWNPCEPSQLFWVDDAFGSTQYEPRLAFAWNRALAQVKAAINGGTKIIMTSRDYIYGSARDDLKTGAFPLLQERQIAIDVQRLTLVEKRQILYNHIKLGNQPHKWRSAIKPHLETIATHPRFIPETARRLGNSVFSKELVTTERELLAFVEGQEQLLQEVIRGLDSHSKAALGLIYMRAGTLASPVRLSGDEEDAMTRLGSTLGRCVGALNALKDSLVRYLPSSGAWVFKHPTIADAYAMSLVENPELLGIYLDGVPTDKLMRQVSCGDVQAKNAIVIPSACFKAVIERLATLSRALLSERDLFLARRCSPAFLQQYLAKDPAVLERITSPGLMLDAVPEVELALRLHECGLLSEKARAEFVQALTEYAVAGDDPFILQNEGARLMLTEMEYETLLVRLRAELIPNLSNARWNLESNWPSQYEPEEFMAPFFATLDALEKEFQDAAVQRAVDDERRRAAEWIAEHETETKRPPRASSLSCTTGVDVMGQGSRSMFDDIDQ